MDTHPYWTDTASAPRFPRLASDVDVDVVIIGGGITGITAAYLFKRAGRSVALLERGQCIEGESGHTTAHLTAIPDTGLQSLVASHGKSVARAVWDAGVAAIDQICRITEAEALECEFRWVPNFLHAPLEEPTPHDARRLADEARFAQELEIPARFHEAVPFFQRAGVEFPHQALFHPRKYLAGLLERIPGSGSHVFEHSEADAFEDQPLAVRVGPHRIRAGYLVLATHTPPAGLASSLGTMAFHTKLSWNSTYAIGGRIPSGLVPEASYYDTSDPYHYLRVERRRGHDYAIFGGEDHKTGHEPDTARRFDRLEATLRRFLPQLAVEHRWSGQVIETNDGLPFIGETARHQFIATGFAGNGMTFGTLSALMAVDAAFERRNPWEKVFAPSRKKVLGGAWDYLTENKDYPYHLLRDRLARGDKRSPRELARGEGAIVSLDGKKVAAHCDEQGQLTLLSPVCTHLQCIVNWNTAERTWDCPCHGSRFSPTGEVMAGPAREPLARLPTPSPGARSPAGPQ